MTVVFEQTLTESREPAPPDRAGRRSLKARLRALQRQAAFCVTRLRLTLAGRAGGSRILSNKSTLLVAGDRLLREAHRIGRPLSLALFEFGDLREVRSIYGRAVKREAMAQVVARMASAAGARGLVARTGATEFALVLPGADRNRAVQAICRAMGDPVRIEIESDHREIMLVPEFRIGCAGPEIASFDDCYRGLCLEIQDARRLNAEREQYLTRERERHSRPNKLGLPPGHPDAHGPGADVPPTVPDSLHSRWPRP
jgi:GGDEF domain-containing protein